MSKASHVKASLETDPRIVIVGVIEEKSFPYWPNDFCHTLRYVIAPKARVYGANALNKLLRSLIPGLRRSDIDLVDQCDQDEHNSGTLYYDECVGEVKECGFRKLTLTDQGLKSTKGFVKGVHIEIKDTVKPLLRRIWVDLHTCKKTAREVFKKSKERDFHF